MTDQDLKRESEQAMDDILDNGGTRSGEDRRQNCEPYCGKERRSGRDRRRGFDRRTGLPRRRMTDRRSASRFYWSDTAIERRDAFRK